MRALALSLLILLVAPVAARADWGAPRALTPAAGSAYLMGLTAGGDRPVALAAVRSGHGYVLRLLREGAAGRTVASSRASFERGNVFAGGHGDLVAGWLELVNGSRRPVVATGPHLEHRQVLAPGPRSTQILDVAANRRGDAAVAFWRYDGQGYAIYAAYRRAGEQFGSAQKLVTGYPNDPTVAVDADGTAVVAWGAKDGVHVATRSAGASVFGADARIEARTASTADVAIDHGRTVVAWTSGRNSGSILAATRERGAASFSAPADVSGTLERFPHWLTPSVAFAGGHALVAWIQGVAHTVTHDRAAFAVESEPGTWQAPQTRGVRSPAHVYAIDAFGSAPGRPAMLSMTVSRPGFHIAPVTASLRADGSLGPSRAPRIGGDAGFRGLIAQGTRHSFLATERVRGPRSHPRSQVVLLRST